MKRAYSVFIAAVILIVVGIGLIVPSAYTASSLLKSVSVNDLAKVLVTRLANNTQIESVPKDASLYDTLKIELKNLIIKEFKNTVSKENESSVQELSLKKLAFHLGLYSLIILIGIILIVNGIISFVSGTVIFVHDRRKIHHR
ncbi:MAG TPA: hypothetical protein VH481_02805 [Nitrososphaeraceae archaeon]|jgi:hypothetical protein